MLHARVVLVGALGLVACGGGVATPNDAPAPVDAGSSDARASGPTTSDAESDALLAVDAGPDSWDAGDAVGCHVAIAAPSSASFVTTAATVMLGGTEIPFARFACGGDAYRVEVEVTGYPDSLASLAVLDARTNTELGNGGCSAVTILRDGTLIASSELFQSSGHLLTLRIGGCTFNGATSATVTGATIQARLAVPH
jgi:hypothetical protein